MMTESVGRGFEVKQYNAYSPKLIAGIKSIPETVSDRSIQIKMKRKLKSEKREKFRRRTFNQESEVPSRVRSQLALWAETSTCHEVLVDDLMPDEIDDRFEDMWEPLFQIAQDVSPEWVERTKRACLALSSGRDLDSNDGVALLRDIKAVFDKYRQVNVFQSEGLVELLKDVPESQWFEEQLDSKKLSKILKEFLESVDSQGRVVGLVPLEGRSWHFSNGNNPPSNSRRIRGYRVEQFADAFARYELVDDFTGSIGSDVSEPHGTPVNVGTDVPVQSGFGTDV
jgi:hypothetical protein